MDSPYLVHATTSKKAKAIEMVGLRIGPKTKRTTGYCKRDDFDCLREEAYLKSEETHEYVRQRTRSVLPSRQFSTFFAPKEGYFCVDDPSSCKTGEDDRGRPIYDFGFGKDTLFVVDATKIPCKCGVGDSAKSDETFNYYHRQARPSPLDKLSKMKPPEVSSKSFWNGAQIFDWRKFDPYKEDLRGDRKIEDPEIWCPCAVPKSAIIAKFDKNNPLPE